MLYHQPALCCHWQHKITILMLYKSKSKLQLILRAHEVSYFAGSFVKMNLQHQQLQMLYSTLTNNQNSLTNLSEQLNLKLN